MYIRKILKARKNAHTQSHHQRGLDRTMERAETLTIIPRIDEIAMDLVRSLNQSRRGMVLNPYRLSTLKFL
jgi:hypothetical protein